MGLLLHCCGIAVMRLLWWDGYKSGLGLSWNCGLLLDCCEAAVGCDGVAVVGLLCECLSPATSCRYGQISADIARYGEICLDVTTYGQMWPHVAGMARYSQMWLDMARYT